MERRPFVLDGDYGVDDAMALLYLSSEPGVEIAAVGSVHGNTSAATAARNAITVSDLAGLPSVPVAVGAARPLAEGPGTGAAVHGHDGLGGAAPAPTGREREPVATPAALQLIETVRAHPGRCCVVATGPLTNLALALLLDPDLPALVERVVVMGGTVLHPGNVGPSTEFNIARDPEAADLVLTAGWPVTLVGLDVTMQTWLGPEDLDRIAASRSARGRFVWSILQGYLDAYRERHGRLGCPLHDPTAARIAVDPALADHLDAPVRVELQSARSRGMLVVDRRPFAPRDPDARPVRIAMGADRNAVVRRFLAGMLGEPLPD